MCYNDPEAVNAPLLAAQKALYELLKEQVALEEGYSAELAAKTAEIERLRQQLADRANPAEVSCGDRMVQQPGIEYVCC